MLSLFRMPKENTSEAELKKKKKKWKPIFSGKEFNEKEIGETFVEDSEKAVGKTIAVNLTTMTGDPKKQNFNITFKIVDAKDNRLNASITGYFLQVAQKKRLSRKDKDKLEDSFVYKTKDGIDIAIKPVFITKSLTYHSKHTLIRHESRKILSEIAKNTAFTPLMKSIIEGNLQKDMKSQLKKVYPINTILIKAALINN